MALTPKQKADNRNAADIYSTLVRERTIEWMSAHAPVTRLHKTKLDTVDFIRSNPNDRIKYAVESGYFQSEQI